MNTTYELCKDMITKGTYKTQEDMRTKICNFWLIDEITKEQFEELKLLLFPPQLEEIK